MGKLIRYLASMLPLPLSWRGPLYRWSGMTIGPQVTIDRNLHVTAADQVTIGARVTIANAVSILGNVTTVHSRLGQEFDVEKTAPVVIEDDAYIGAKATILPGVRIGRMATVSANTLVTSSVPDYGVVVGVPGRVFLIRTRATGSEPEDAAPET
jgi:acetyltransferase-like isoleucine patch superfamily enzyme